MKAHILIGALLVIAAIGIATWYWVDSSPDVQAKSRLTTGKTRKQSSPSPADAVRSAMSGMGGRTPGGKSGRADARPPLDIFAHLTGKDKKLAEEMQEALDADDQGTVFALTVRALASTNAEVRLNAVEALAWFGAEALPELTGAMADADEDVAMSAENAWEMALSEIDDASRRFSIAAAAMSSIHNADHLTTISGQLEGAALELIDGEDDPDKASGLRLSIVQKLVDIMESSSEVNTAQAQAAYETITGNEWISVEEAERYLDDPDNYEPPEDREEEDDVTGRAEEVESSEEVENVEPVEKADEANGGETEPEQEDAEPAQEDVAESEQKDVDSEQ